MVLFASVPNVLSQKSTDNSDLKFDYTIEVINGKEVVVLDETAFTIIERMAEELIVSRKLIVTLKAALDRAEGTIKIGDRVIEFGNKERELLNTAIAALESAFDKMEKAQVAMETANKALSAAVNALEIDNKDLRKKLAWEKAKGWMKTFAIIGLALKLLFF